MHEMSIATHLMDQLERIAAEQNVVRITEVEVHCGVMQQVVPEALELAFEALSGGGVAAGADLRIVEEPLRVRCRLCGAEFAAELDDMVCRACQDADVEVLTGKDIVLRSVICETVDEADHEDQRR